MKEKALMIALTLLCAFELGQSVDFAAGQVIFDWTDGSLALAKTLIAGYVAWKMIFPKK